MHLCSAGNPGMASGGMGDVLSGIIGALLAQKLEFTDAARVGVYIHGKAADEAAKMVSEVCKPLICWHNYPKLLTFSPNSRQSEGSKYGVRVSAAVFLSLMKQPWWLLAAIWRRPPAVVWYF
ncbi:NAD(P)H-hydrate dehydratase [Aliamphritea spongicola]|nr:NAD(P)H-hydrate dehydratase [Aliamphritea spongicola]